MLVGVAVCVFFLFVYNPGVKAPSFGGFGGGGEVLNLGLLQTRQNGLFVGLTLWLSGLLCVLIPAKQQ